MKKIAPPPTTPAVVTVGITELTDSSVKVGGKVTTDSKELIASGFCWSVINETPTIADDTTVAFSPGGMFATELKDLDPSTTYYIRAYAINKTGVGYGEIIKFLTNNGAPRIEQIDLTGVGIVNSILSVTYVYSDFENDPDSATAIQWYSATDTSGTTDSPISGAINSTYTVSINDTTRFIRAGITPFAASGSSPGLQKKSVWVGPVTQ
jgi:hypothetical protein